MTTINKQKRIAVIGATGSIGTQTLDIAAAHPELYRPVVLTAGSRVDELVKLARRHRPELVVIADEKKYGELRKELEPLGMECAAGAEAIADAAALADVDMVVTATVGYSGLMPTVRAVEAGKQIALANKETLVVAGALIEKLVARSGSLIYPVDSEHSAIFQSLAGEDRSKLKRLLITASGGPFRTWPMERIALSKAADALKHPNWSMGAKITIDSASMMNKAFELIEARWLFNVTPDQLSAVVHPQSVVHSMVEFTDGAIKAQLGVPDMHLPIAYALGCAERLPGAERCLTLEDMATLTFEKPDTERFPCLTLASYALERGGNTACVVNAANEIAVDAYLHDRIAFYDIYRVITETLQRCDFIADPQLSDYIQTNKTARLIASELL